MKSNYNAFHRFKVLRVKHGTRNSQSIDCLSCREDIGKVLIRIALVVIDNGIAEID